MSTSQVELLDGTYRPITNTIGFFECTAESAAKEFHSWKDRTYSRDGRKLCVERLETDSLAIALDSLLPLTSRSLRWLFIETQSGGCAYFENWWRGTDPTPIAPLAARIPCRGICCTNNPNGKFPATIIEVFKPKPGKYWDTERSICAMNDGGQWIFETSGEPFEFEQIEKYQKKRKRDRFTSEMLNRYLKRLGVSAFKESFYHTPGCVAYLVRVDGPKNPSDIKEYTLNEVQ